MTEAALFGRIYALFGDCAAQITVLNVPRDVMNFVSRVQSMQKG